MQDDMDAVQENVGTTRQVVGPDCKVLMREGNHERRRKDYLDKHPELAGLDGLSARKLYGLDAFDVAWDDADFMYWAGRVITHGEVVRQVAGQSARGEMEKWGTSGISHHVHRLAEYRKTTLLRDDLWVEGGCLCRLDPPYLAGRPNWQHGFVVVERLGDDWSVELVPIRDGKAAFRGTVYKSS
jgi:hypothetical protein